MSRVYEQKVVRLAPGVAAETVAAASRAGVSWNVWVEAALAAAAGMTAVIPPPLPPVKVRKRRKP